MLNRFFKKIVTGVLLIFSAVVNGSPLKSDETVIFFPTAAHLNKDSQWEVPIHLWVFEKEDQNIVRKLAQKVLSEIAEVLEIPEDQANSPIFRQRILWFLVDNERRKNFEITLESFADSADVNADVTPSAQTLSRKLNLSTANGHSKTTILVPSKSLNSKQLNYQVHTDNKNLVSFVGQSQLIPPIGVSVISDIDDTIKISEVLDKKALMRNTFVEDFKTTPNMPELYKSLKSRGVYFHYVSASPWQIYPTLKPFMDEYYPLGSYTLRNFRLTDSSILRFIEPSKEYKIEAIRKIILKYPQHRFILIGDSGEHDPEVYAIIYKEFAKNIENILIRGVPKSDLSDVRFAKTFAGIPKDLWRILNDDDVTKY